MLLKYEVSVEDLEYLKELQGHVNADFNSALAELKRADLFDSKRLENLAKEDEATDEVDAEEREPLFQKLFRKVVVITHPDKYTDDMPAREKVLKQDLYDRAAKANKSYNWAELISVAMKLEIELSDEYHPYVNDLQSEVDRVQQRIQNIESSIAWKWYHSPVEQRDRILAAYVSHIEKMIASPKRDKRLILGVGHPRTGTGFTAKALTDWGLEVGHEAMGRDGMVAWQLAVPPPWLFIQDVKPFDHQVLIYNVRNPKTSIPSIVFTENINPESVNFRLQHGVQRSNNRVEHAILSILRWDFIINRLRPDITYRIEDEAPRLYEALKAKGVISAELVVPGVVNERQHPDWTALQDELVRVRPSLRAKINDYCVRYGYELLYS